jgi:hypothetical protein
LENKKTLINACIKACNQHLAVNPNDPEISHLWKQLNLSSGQGLMGFCSKLIYEKQEHIGKNIEKLPEEVKEFMKNRGQEVRTPEQISNSSTSRFTKNTDYSTRQTQLQLPSMGSQALLPSGQIASIFRKKWILGSVGFVVAAIGILLMLSGAAIPLGIPAVAAAMSVPLLSQLAFSIGGVICGLVVIVVTVKLKNLFNRIKIDRIKNEMGYPPAKIQTTDSSSPSSSRSVAQSPILNPPDAAIRAQYDNVFAGKRVEDNRELPLPLAISGFTPKNLAIFNF